MPVGTGLETALLAAVLVALEVLAWTSAVVVLATFGWAVSSLHVLAGWSDGTLAARLEIVRGLLASICAGGVAAFAGLYYNLPVVAICLCIFFAGSAGQQFLVPIGQRFLSRMMGAFDAFFGKNGGSHEPPKD